MLEKLIHFPAFWSLFGLAACLLLALVSKGLVKILLQRKEDYYDA